MPKNYSLTNEGVFVIDDYTRAFPFSNFLPALSGIWGIPLWAFYVNRAQGMVSFGVQDKNHAIGEFYPADRAYRIVSSVGFRTFIKIDGKINYEPFGVVSNYAKKEKMLISSYDLAIEEVNLPLKLKFSVNYFTMPNTNFASLVRVLKIKNLSSRRVNLDVVDGLPRIIPFGTRDLFLKYLSRTIEAWMYSNISRTTATFRLLVDPKDAAQTKFVEGTNFCHAFFKGKGLSYPRYIVDPPRLFGSDLSFSAPLNFLKKSFKYPDKQMLCGRTPCAFSLFDWRLGGGEEKSFYSLWGGVFEPALLKDVKRATPDFIEKKKEENKQIVEAIKDNAFCLSNINSFNHYVKATYLDNILRGGLPFSYHRNKSYYIFSRKHGDLERDYNKFNISATYFSEGESNYRDVNQNRRMDLFFNPFIEKGSLVYFLNLLKIDGYNPLVVKGEKLHFDRQKDIKSILADFGINEDISLLNLMRDGFYVGELLIFLAKRGVDIKQKDSFVNFLLMNAKREPQAIFGEGYWIDHWRYNLDLIESFLYFYPDKHKELFLDTEFIFWDDQYKIKKRIFKYILKDSKIYQYQSLQESEEKRDFINKRSRYKNFLREKQGKGRIYTANLFVKLLSLVLNKAATLDPDGIGIEMEADKPGWCDSLNG
ncbi:MAG: hypothetical protein ABH858_00265, partial [Candidatus Omnitrophota bacterium]